MRGRIKNRKETRSPLLSKGSSTPLNDRGIRQKRQIEQEGFVVVRNNGVLKVKRGKKVLFEAKGREDFEQLEDTKFVKSKNFTQIYHTYQIGVAPKRETPRGPNKGPAYDTGIFKPPQYVKNMNNKQIIITLTGYKKGFAPQTVIGYSGSFKGDDAYEKRFEEAKQSALTKLCFTPDDIRIESVQVREIVAK